MRATDAVLRRGWFLRRPAAGVVLASLFAIGFASATSQPARARPALAPVSTTCCGEVLVTTVPSSVGLPRTVTVTTTETVATTQTVPTTVTTSRAVAVTRTVTATSTITRTNTLVTTITRTHSGWTWTAGGLALVALLGAGGAASLAVRSRRRSAWQLAASKGDPPLRCVAPGTFCKVEETLKPARRTIESIAVAGAEGKLEAGRSVVGGVNDAVAIYRREGPGEEVRLALAPVADALLQQIATQFRDGTVSGDAHLTGGKLESAFTLYRCVGGVWDEQQHWTVDRDDERDLAIGEIELPGSVERVTALLAAFVTGVDVAEPETAPERLPVTHV